MASLNVEMAKTEHRYKANVRVADAVGSVGKMASPNVEMAKTEHRYKGNARVADACARCGA